jgi:hypothetical protein
VRSAVRDTYPATGLVCFLCDPAISELPAFTEAIPAINQVMVAHVRRPFEMVTSEPHTESMPRLIANFPGWLLLQLGASAILSTAGRELPAHKRQ